MRRILYIIILALLFFAPVKRLDVAKLEPVQTVAVYMQDDQIVIETDTDNIGKGSTVHDAIDDLEQTTPGVIYLDTAEYLLLSKNAIIYIDAIRQYLAQNVRVCLWDEEGSVKDAAKYLSVRKNLPKIKEFNENRLDNFSWN